MLTNIVLKILKYQGYKVKRVSIFEKEGYNTEPDMNIIDNSGEEFLVEIKAYGKYKRICKREIEQLTKYLKSENIKNGILITSSVVVSKIPDNIKVINGDNLHILLKRYKLLDNIDKLNWIQTARVNKKEIIEAKENKRKIIIQFILDNPKMVKVRDIEKTLCVDLRTYLGTNRTKAIEKIRKEKKNLSSNNDNALVYTDHP